MFCLRIVNFDNNPQFNVTLCVILLTIFSIRFSMLLIDLFWSWFGHLGRFFPLICDINALSLFLLTSFSLHNTTFNAKYIFYRLIKLYTTLNCLVNCDLFHYTYCSWHFGEKLTNYDKLFPEDIFYSIRIRIKHATKKENLSSYAYTLIQLCFKYCHLLAIQVYWFDYF